MKIVRFHGRGGRRALIAPAGQKLIQGPGFQDRAGNDMRADFRALFQQTDAQFAPVFLSKLSEANRSGETAGPRPYDDDVKLHAFARVHCAGSVHGGTPRVRIRAGFPGAC